MIEGTEEERNMAMDLALSMISAAKNQASSILQGDSAYEKATGITPKGKNVVAKSKSNARLH